MNAVRSMKLWNTDAESVFLQKTIMAYNRFNFKTVGEKLGISFGYDSDFLQGVTPITVRPELIRLIQPNDYFPLHTEIARREWIIGSVFRELIDIVEQKISVYSGETFDVEPSLGLNGAVDYLIAKGKARYPIEGPIIAVAEAKPDNLLTGLGQCIAEMYAARLYNERKNNPIRRIFGVVTTGLIWGFLVLEGDDVRMDSREYGIDALDEVLGILVYMTQNAD